MDKITYIGAEWCPKCKVYKPKFEDYCKKEGIEYTIADADKDSELVDKYGIRNIPVVVIESEASCIIKDAAIFLEECNTQ
jgi:thiol-disulfide isomerase/thioredoxin